MKRVFCFILFLSQLLCLAQFQGNETLIKLELVLLNSSKDTISFTNLYQSKGLQSFDKGYTINFFERKKYSNENISDRILFLKPKLKKKLLEIGYTSYVNNDDSEKVNEDFCSDLIVVIKKKKKTMKLEVRIYKQYEAYKPWIINQSFEFKEGIFEITDPENPKLAAKL